MTWLLAVLLRPFVLVVLAVAVLYPARKAVERWWPEGRVKRVLLFRVSDADAYGSGQRGDAAHEVEHRVTRSV